MSDLEREILILRAYQALCTAQTPEERTEAAREMAQLCLERSPQKVWEMEIERGLR